MIYFSDLPAPTPQLPTTGPTALGGNKLKLAHKTVDPRAPLRAPPTL